MSYLSYSMYYLNYLMYYMICLLHVKNIADEYTKDRRSNNKIKPCDSFSSLLVDLLFSFSSLLA